MQEGYLVQRDERFETMIRLLGSSRPSLTRIVDLGCGPGSFMIRLLEAFSEVQIFGIDIDPTLLPLAQKQTAHYADRVHLYRTDLRNQSWMQPLPQSVDAVVSATALHWLTRGQLQVVYEQIASILRPGGIFLNADHVGSDVPEIQHAWEQHRETMREAGQNPLAEDWESFWQTYLSVLGNPAGELRERALGTWEGSEEGYPLTWHFDQLKACGFSSVECFWRCDCDAIYGGIRS
jgi:SAM-dependent methyltransferase